MPMIGLGTWLILNDDPEALADDKEVRRIYLGKKFRLD
tara:strand:+ start:980 stop:1093 length:114 start_codon:yes stop_codon:yes gene_type:complete